MNVIHTKKMSDVTLRTECEVGNQKRANISGLGGILEATPVGA